MFNYKKTWEAMRKERASVQAELDKLDRAISALTPLVDGAAPTKVKLSLNRRQQISQAQNKASKSNQAKPKIESGLGLFFSNSRRAEAHPGFSTVLFSNDTPFNLGHKIRRELLVLFRDVRNDRHNRGWTLSSKSRQDRRFPEAAVKLV